ncbi:hypothetical protein ACNKHT_18015 [Shigella flexneri]
MAGIRRAGMGENCSGRLKTPWQMLIEEAWSDRAWRGGVKCSVIYCRVRTLAGKE